MLHITAGEEEKIQRYGVTDEERELIKRSRPSEHSGTMTGGRFRINSRLFRNRKVSAGSCVSAERETLWD